MGSLIAELKRRNVFKVGIAYAIVAWLLIQIASILFPTFHAPEWVMQAFTVFIILGFPLALILAWAYEMTPEGIKPTPAIGSVESIANKSGKRFNYIIIGLMALAIAFLVIDNYVLVDKGHEASGVKSEEQVVHTKPLSATAPSAVAESEPAIPHNSIAVLPFTDMSPDRDQDYFADGIAEEILNSLAGIKDLEVRGRTSSFYFKGKHEELHTISEMLHVEYVLEGSVRKDADQVRITVQLINAQQDEHLWSKTYDRKLKDIFAIQEDIAKSIADTLQISLGVGELGLTPGMTRNVAAYDAFLAGNSFFTKLGRENVSRAVEDLEKAVSLDPDFAFAWLSLYAAYHNTAILYQPEKAGEYETKSEAALARVAATAPGSVVAVIATAGLHMQHREWVAAEQSCKKLLVLAPATYGSNMTCGNFLSTVGRPTAAIDYLQRVVRIEPLDPISRLMLGIAYLLSGDSTEAERSFLRNKDLTDQKSTPNILLLVLALTENNQSHIKEYSNLLVNSDLRPNSNRQTTRDIFQVMPTLLDTPETAGSELQKFLNDPAYHHFEQLREIAAWAAYYGEDALALQAFQEASDFSTSEIFTIWEPLYKPMRRLPGFKDLVRKFDLVNYWRTTGNWGEFCHPVGEDDFECI